MISLLAIANVPSDQLKAITALTAPYGLDVCTESEYTQGQKRVAVLGNIANVWHIVHIEL
jgi:hypothetical protein